MDYQFHREAILTGCVDSYCLACEEYLKCERDAATHVSKPVHRNNLLAVPYMDKYCDDHIRKVKKGYFCEFCNLLLPTAAKVGLHVVETHHVDNKATKLLKRIGNTVIAVGNVSISERAWHGLMEDTCAICNVEYDNEDIHKNQPTHILRLIQCKIQYGAGKILYRLIDNDSFQCLTCNMVISLKTIIEHSNNSDHQKLYSQCLVSANPDELHDPAINNHEEKLNDRKDLGNFQMSPDPDVIKNIDESPHIKITNEKNRKKILDSINKIQRSDINVDFERESAFCKKCLTALDFNYNLIEQHMQEHVRKPMKTADSALYYPTADQKHNKISLTVCDEPPTCDQKTKDEESFTYKHNIRALSGEDEVKSDDCKDTGGKNNDYDLSESSSSEHNKNNGTKPSVSNVTEDSSVSENTKQKNNSFNKQSKLSGDFIKEFILVNNEFMQAKRVIINLKYLIDIKSFMLVTKQDSGFRCQVCEVNIIEDDCTDHVNSSIHKNKLNKTPVITSLDTEFVREVRPGLLHCGYCHQFFSDWDDLRNHMKSSDHKEIKTLSEILLEKSIREIDEEKERNVRLMFLRMMMGNPFF